jgi:hypothetical protein
MDASGLRGGQADDHELRLRKPRIAWWTLIFLLATFWFFEITSFNWWWGMGGVILGIFLGPFLLPAFPLIAVLEGAWGRAVAGLLLLFVGAALFRAAGPEVERFLRALRGLRR